MSDEFDRPKFYTIGDKAIRIDQPPDAGQPQAPPTGRAAWLALFRALFAGTGEERRIMPRHKAATLEIWLGWSRGNEAYFSKPARLVNVSRGGALIFLTDPPPEGRTVWVCLCQPEPDHCLEATVLEVRSVKKECSVRIEFREPCPHSFFESAVCMIAPPNPRCAARLGTGEAEA